MRLDESGLLAKLHEGMREQPLFSAFLEQLRMRTAAIYTSLRFRPQDDAAMIEVYAGPPPSAGLHRLLVEKYAFDPFQSRRMRTGRVYALDELFDPDDAEMHAYRRDILGPLGVTNMRSVRVSEAGGVDAWLSCGGGQQLRSGTDLLLGDLVPHLRVALGNFLALERERLRSSVTGEAIRRMNFGWLMLDANCRIVDIAPHAEQYLERTPVLKRGRYDRLIPASPAIDRELTALVRQFAGDSAARPRALNLSRDPWVDMLVTPAQSRSLSASSTPVAIAYLSGDRWSEADRCEQLVELFGLLPSEARVAWAIAQGLSIAEAATALGLSEETTRTYSKKIYAKTGAGGQAQLVRIILTSVLALA